MLAHMLRQLGGCHANRASFNNHLGVPLTLAALPAAALPAVQEIGMNAPGEISLLTGLAKPNIAVITRIADSHAGFFDSLDDIAAAKAEIFDGLAPGGIAVLNADDPYFDMLAVCVSPPRASEPHGADPSAWPHVAAAGWSRREGGSAARLHDATRAQAALSFYHT